MKNKRIQDQPYQIAFSATAVMGGAVYLFLFIIFITTIAYVLFFLPLSYVGQEKAREIWQFIVWTIWIVAFLASIFQISLRFSYNREIRWLGRIAFYSNLVIWGIVLALNSLGLYPISVFVPSIAIATALTYFLVDELFILTLQYNHYLSRSIELHPKKWTLS